MLIIDGSIGEGGGQALRSSLALSLVTGTPVRIENIRARRPKPGLMRQHLTAVNAAVAIGRATVRGAEIGSRTLEFEPTEIVAGEQRFSIGTAGSATLVLQTILPALWRAAGPASIVVEGGTHNPLAPPFDFLARVYLPLMARMGATATATLERHGFFPSGGGCVRLEVTPAPSLRGLQLVERGRLTARRATAIVAALPFDIARRELDVVRARLGFEEAECRPVVLKEAQGPGNVVVVEVEHEHVTESFAAFGERGVAAEIVAERVCGEVEEYLGAGVAVGRHLADQLLVPLALAGGGEFVSLEGSAHLETQVEVLRRFGVAEVIRERVEERAWRFEVRK